MTGAGIGGRFLQVGASGGAAQNAQAYARGGSGLPDPKGRNTSQFVILRREASKNLSSL